MPWSMRGWATTPGPSIAAEPGTARLRITVSKTSRSDRACDMLNSSASPLVERTTRRVSSSG